MKKAIPLLVVLFVGYWIATDSSGFVDTFQSVSIWTVDAIGVTFGKIIDIVQGL